MKADRNNSIKSGKALFKQYARPYNTLFDDDDFN